MCPFFLLTFFFSILLLFAEIAAAVISVTFNPPILHLHQGKSRSVEFTIKLSNSSFYNDEIIGNYYFSVDRPDVAEVKSKDFTISSNQIVNNEFKGSIDVQANFLGYSRIELQKKSNGSNIFDNLAKNKTLKQNYQLLVSVVRDKDLISKIFVYSVIIVVSISYINMGCALDIDAVYQVLRRPIAPAIGFFSQYFCMPIISYGLASYLLNETYLKLGLFIFGCSPGGGASNMWAVLLGANLNLSITMTFLSTLLSIGMMPFWLYTLGRTIFEGTTTTPPVRNIFSTLGSMVIFLGIGLLIKRFLPRLANICRRILAPFSGAMIIFIVIFGTYANLYMFKVMTWPIFLAAASNVWSGMLIGFLIAYAFGKSLEDLVAIAIETGVQNTGVSIVVLALSLPQPDADLAAAVPVAASIMTPIPLTIAYIIIKIRHFLLRRKHVKILYSDPYEHSFTNKSSSNESNLTSIDTGRSESDSKVNSTRASNISLVKSI